MNAGSIVTSKRLQQTLAVLQDGCWHTTLDIAQHTCSVAVHSDMHAIKCNGIDYETRQNGRVHAYRLIKKEAAKEGQKEMEI